MPYGSMYIDTVQSSTSNTTVSVYDGNSRETGRFCRAFMQYNGSATSLNATFNVSSVTKNSTGYYTTNHSVAIQDSQCSATSTAYNSALYAVSLSSTTATSITLSVYNSASSLFDTTLLCAAIFR